MEFNWAESGRFAVGSTPNGLDDLDRLSDLGIRGIITLMESSLADHLRIEPEELGRKDFVRLHTPVKDTFVPSHVQFLKVFAAIDNFMPVMGRPVFMHSRLGQGRTGTMLHAFYLAKGFTLEQVKAKIELIRPVCSFSYLSERQRQFIEDRAAKGPLKYVDPPDGSVGGN